MDTITHEVRESHWKSVIEQCQQRPEGISARSWMQENGISEKSYNYWFRKMRQKAYEQITSSTDLSSVQKEEAVTFAKIPISPVHIANEISSSFEPAAVIKVKCSIIVFPIPYQKNCWIEFCRSYLMLEDAGSIRHVVLACGYVDLQKGIDGLLQMYQDLLLCLRHWRNALFL